MKSPPFSNFQWSRPDVLARFPLKYYSLSWSVRWSPIYLVDWRAILRQLLLLGQSLLIYIASHFFFLASSPNPRFAQLPKRTRPPWFPRWDYFWELIYWSFPTAEFSFRHEPLRNSVHQISWSYNLTNPSFVAICLFFQRLIQSAQLFGTKISYCFPLIIIAILYPAVNLLGSPLPLLAIYFSFDIEINPQKLSRSSLSHRRSSLTLGFFSLAGVLESTLRIHPEDYPRVNSSHFTSLCCPTFCFCTSFDPLMYNGGNNRS